jgi:hypothetical protein
MGLFNRVMATSRAGLPEVGRQGQGLLGNLSIVTKTTNADHTITVAEMSGGMIYYDSLSAGRNVTTPTAALILAAAPDMDIGDSFSFIVSIQDAFAITWVAGTNVTLVGRATTPASSFSIVTVTKLTATTVQWHIS